jgi:hypothetical protein
MRRIIGRPGFVRFQAVFLASSEFLHRLTTEYEEDQGVLEVLGWARAQTEKCRGLKGEITMADLEVMLRSEENQVEVTWEREGPGMGYSIKDDQAEVIWILTAEYLKDVLNVDFTERP